MNLAVDITVHGPIMTQVGQRMAVDWMGNVPSDDIAALFGINEATDFTQFRAALTGWRAPTQNFVYADKAGNIGVIAPGYYPQVAAGCQPWLPMPGTGACDVDRGDPGPGGAAGVRPAVAPHRDREPAAGHSGVPVLHRHQR